MAEKAPFLYRHFFIPKANGGRRLVEAPCPDLKKLQHKLLTSFLHSLPIHPTLYGGPGTSIKDAVAEHVRKSVVITLDIENFFPSVKSCQIRRTLLDRGCPNDTANLLTRLLSRDHHLPQGAPTSPCVGRLVLHRFACDLTDLMRSTQRECAVSIYVDDITVSGPQGIVRLIPTIYKMLKRHGFQAKTGKTNVMRRDVEQASLNIRLNDRMQATTKYLAEVEQLARMLPETDQSLKGKRTFVEWVSRP